MVLADPVDFLGHEGLDDRRGHFGVVVAAQRVADVVQQRHDHILLVTAVAVRASRGLERVLEAAHGKAPEIAVEQAQVFEHAVG